MNVVQPRREPSGAAPRSESLIRIMVIVLVFVAAPTAGDIGSTCQPADDLDPLKFFSTKESVDCEQCIACGISTATCARACDTTLELTEFATGCYPLVHDGEVCLNALRAADCDDYESYVADVSPTVPTECNFCPAKEQGE